MAIFFSACFVSRVSVAVPSAPAKEELVPFTPVTLDRMPYLSLVDLAESYHLGLMYDPVTLTMTVSRGAQRISVANLSTTARFNRELVRLGRPARLIRGAMYVPATTFLPVLSRMLHTTLSWDSRRNGVITPGFMSTITGVSLEERAQGTLIRISLGADLKYRYEAGRYNWLTITFEGGVLARSLGISVPPEGMVIDSRFTQREDEAQLSFRITGDMESYDVSRASDTGDILIALRKRRPSTAAGRQATPGGTVDDVIESVVPKPVEPTFDENEWRIDTVIIDPGHGGRDSGAVGPKGTKEKDIVLAISKELKKLFDERGEVNAVMTRSDDVFVGLYQRATAAKRSNGKLFVSVHANASKNRTARGMEVFFLSAAKTDDARMVEDRENAAVAYEDNPSASRKMLNGSNLLSDIERDMASNVFLKESQDLCSILLDSAIPATRQENRGVKQAGFYVLAGTLAAMPSILFEVGFISNPEEERMLNRISYQKRIAQSIYDAVMKFKSRHERGLFTRSR